MNDFDKEDSSSRDGQPSNSRESSDGAWRPDRPSQAQQKQARKGVGKLTAIARAAIKEHHGDPHKQTNFILPLLLYFALRDARNAPTWQMYLFCGANTLLYPYSRFVYEGLADFVLGDNVFYVSAWPALAWKLLTMIVAGCLLWPSHQWGWHTSTSITQGVMPIHHLVSAANADG